MDHINNQNDLLLSVRDLVVEYSSNKKIIHAVNGVSFDLERGKTLGLVGETGAGKTTIAKSILRILPQPPAKICSGQVLLDGEDLMQVKEERMRSVRGSKISMVFQDPMTALNPVMRVGKQVAEVVKFHEGISWAAAKDKAAEMLGMVGISEDRFREYPHQFSGGMKQRIVIAMALACSPELLLADEPTTALDVTIQAQVLNMMKRLKEEHGTSMILITHDLGIVAGTCDYVAVVYAGKIVEYGSREEIFDHCSHPYTKGLFGALPDISRSNTRLVPIKGSPVDPSVAVEGCAFAPRCPYAAADCTRGTIDPVHLGGTHTCSCIHTGMIRDGKEA
ncbi:MAG: ABC transporter ATP-binding protein [Oscillospiraceae bacterium]